jgi:hypothetical protein
MSVAVDLGELAERLGDFGFAYLVTVGEDRRVHLVAVTPALDGDQLIVTGLGRHSTANAATNPAVTLVWPPPIEGGYSLIVDGQATTADASVSVAPTRAVLHRPAVGPDDSRCGTGSDCVPIDLGGP